VSPCVARRLPALAPLLAPKIWLAPLIGSARIWYEIASGHGSRLLGHPAGSLVSVGSSGSILSIGSAGSILCIGSAGVGPLDRLIGGIAREALVLTYFERGYII